MIRIISPREFHRAGFFVFKINRYRVCNTRHIQMRAFSRICEYREVNGSRFSETKLRPDVTPLRFVSTAINKIGTVGLPKVSPYANALVTERKYGALLCQHHCVLSSTLRKQYLNSANVRCFSEGPSKDAIIPAPVQLEGIWKTMAECAPVEFAQNTLVALHSTTGLPWWATIILATWSIRAFVTLPLALSQHRVLAKYHNLHDELNAIVKQLKNETNYAVHAFNWTEKYARAIYYISFKKQRQKLIERDNCHPLKSICLVLVQIPMWITLSTALRNLCYVLPYNTESARTVYFELTTGGFGWVTDLTVPDNMYIIPVALGVLNLTIIEMQNLLRPSKQTKSQKNVAHFFRLVSVAMIPLASFVPTAISLYWTSSSAFGVVQNLVLMSPKVRRLARIPPTDCDIERPYNQLYTNLCHKIGLSSNALQDSTKQIIHTSKRATK